MTFGMRTYRKPLTGRLTRRSDHRPRSSSCILLANKADERLLLLPVDPHTDGRIRCRPKHRSCARSRSWKPAASSRGSPSSTIPEPSDPAATTLTIPEHRICHPPVPDLELPRPDSTRAPAQRGTGRVPERHPTGVPDRDLLNPLSEPSTEPASRRHERAHVRCRNPGGSAGRMPETSYLPLRLPWHQAGPTENLHSPSFATTPPASDIRRESWLDVSRIYPTRPQDLTPILWRGAANAKTSDRARSP